MKSRYVVKQPELVNLGEHDGVIAVIDYMPDVDTTFGVRNQVRLGIDTDQDGKTGDPIRVFLTLNDSLHYTSRLYQVLTALNKDPKPGFDFNTLLGLPVEFEIVHNTAKDGRVWSNIKDKDLRLKRSSQQKAADQRSVERIERATQGVQQQPKNGEEIRSQYKEENKPLVEDKNEITDTDIPF